MGTQDYFHALVEVATAVNSSLEPQTVLTEITKQTVKAMHCKAGSIRLLDRTGKMLLPAASYGFSSDYLRKGPVEPAKGTLDADVLGGRIIHVRDVRRDTGFQYPADAHAEGVASVLSAPLTVDEHPIGVLRVYTAEERDFLPEELEFLRGVANISAIAIENARMTEALRTKYELLAMYHYQIYED